MFRRTFVSAALLACVLVSGAGVAGAQAPAAPAPSATDKAIEQLRKDARTEINAIISTSMMFTSDENAKFWPLYKAYEERRKPMADERLSIIRDYAKNYASMSDAKALELMQRALALEEKMAAGKREFLAELGKHFPGKTVARFSQVHRRVDMLVDLMIAQEVPLVQ